MADEQQELKPHINLEVMAPKPNGLHAEMEDADLLAELSAETVGASYGYVKLKLTHGAEEKYITLKVRPIDVLKLANDIDAMPKKTKKEILDATRHAMSVGFSDDTWLQSLGAFVWGLASPHVLKDGAEVVWVPDGEPQDLPRAMVAVVKAGFDFWHINDVSNKVTMLTRDRQDGDFLGNS